MARRSVKVFISSPGDVGQERLICARILDRLQSEFSGFLEIKPMLWEHEPLRAHAHFQEEIEKPSDADIVVCILWSRLGTRLPDQFRRADGTTYDSGTEWEFEDALISFRETGKPDIMVYRKTAPPISDMSDEQALIDRLEQKKKLDAFLNKWFGSHDSGFKSAFHPFDTPDRFEEMAEEHLRRLMRAKVPERLSDDSGAPAVTWTRGSPFRGLAAFQYEHAPVFFGRTRWIGEVKDALTRQVHRGKAFVMVLGASGGGKSSLVRAGVIPTLCQPGVVDGIGVWRRATVRPSDGEADIARGIAQALLSEHALPELEGLGYDPATLARLIDRAPDAVIEPLRIALAAVADKVAETERLSRRPEARLALTLDQTEELFTGEAITEDQAVHFIDVIDALARSGLVHVVATMRDDFYHRTARLKKLVTLMEGDGQIHLLPPDFSEIGQMIRQPARAAGLRFELDPVREQRLDEVLQSAAAQDPGALPLMSFVLDELFEARSEEGYLTFEAYEALGGLEGALAKRAEACFAEQPPAVQEALNPVLRRLVTLAKGDEDRPTARRPTRVEAVGEDPNRAALVDAFVEARLLVVDGEGGESHVRVAHEALLTRWPRLAVWLQADKDFLRLRARIADQASHWREEGESPDLLLSEGKPLFDARDLLRGRREDLDEATIAYIEASYAAFQRRQEEVAEAQRRKLKRTRMLAVAMAGLALVAAAGGWLGYSGQKEAESQRAVAESRARDAEAAREEAETLARATAFQARRTEAAREAAEVALLRAEKQTERVLRKQSQFLARISRERANAGDFRTALELALAALPSDFDRPERPYVAEAESALYHALRRFRGNDRLPGHDAAVESIRVAPDRIRMVSAGADGRALVWNAGRGERPVFTLDPRGGRLTDVAVSPDGRRIATAAADGTIALWRASDGGLVSTIPAHAGPIAGLAFDAAGGDIASAGWDGTLVVSRAETGEVLARVRTGGGRFSGLVAHPAGGWIAADLSGRVVFWPGAGQPPRFVSAAESGITALALTPDGARVALGTRDGAVLQVDGIDGRPLSRMVGHGRSVTALAYSPDGGALLSGDRDGKAILWEGATGRQIAVLSDATSDARVVSVDFAPDGTRALAADAGGAVRLWSVTGRPLATLRSEDGLTRALFSADGRHILTGARDGTLRRWRAEGTMNGGAARLFGRMADRADRLVFSADGGVLFAADRQGTLARWDLPDAGVARHGATAEDPGWRVTAHEGRVHMLELSPDGARLATAGHDHTARLWDAATGEALAVLYGHTDDVRDIAFAPDGATLATASDDGTVRLFSARDGALRATLAGHEAAVRRVAWSPDGTRLVSASADGTARLWHRGDSGGDAGGGGDGGGAAADWTADILSPGEGLSGAAPVTAALFAPDGGRVATASADGRIVLWDAADGSAVLRLGGARAVYHLAFAPDGGAIAAGGEGGTVNLWDTRTGYQRAAFAGHGGAVEGLSFDAEGGRLLTASSDGTVRLWDTASGVELARPVESDHAVSEAALDPKGHAVAAGLDDGRLLLAPVFPDTRALVAHARQRRDRPLGPVERDRYFLDVEEGR